MSGTLTPRPKCTVLMFHCSLRLSGNDVSVEEGLRVFCGKYDLHIVLASTNTFPRLGERQTPYAL